MIDEVDAFESVGDFPHFLLLVVIDSGGEFFSALVISLYE